MTNRSNGRAPGANRQEMPMEIRNHTSTAAMRQPHEGVREVSVLADTEVAFVEVADRIRMVAEAIETVIVGKRSVIDLALTALLANGHVLIEDIPGVGKTTLAKAIARTLGCAFKR